MKHLRLGLLAAVMIGAALSSFAGNVGYDLIPKYEMQGWALSKKNHSKGIYIYQKSVPGYEIRSFLATSTVEASIPQLLTLVTDEEIALSFMYKLKSFKILEEISESEVIQYMRIEAPYPVKDRDIVLRVNTHTESGKVILKAVPETGYYPEQEGAVRMDNYFITYILTPQPDGTTYIELEGLGDPGGKVPIWAANMVIDHVPYMSLKRLQRAVDRHSDIDTSKYDMWAIEAVSTGSDGSLVTAKKFKEWPIFKGWQKRWREWSKNKGKEKIEEEDESEDAGKIEIKIL